MTSTSTFRQSGHGAEQEIRWREIFATVFRQKKLITTVTLAGVATVSLLSWLEPPVYRASATIMVQTQRARIPLSPSDARPDADRMSEEEINDVVALLHSASLVREVLEPYRAELDAEQEQTLIGTLKELATLPLRVPGMAYRMLHGLPEPSQFDHLVQATVERIYVEPIKRSNLIDVSYSSRDAAWASDFVNELIQLYITRYALMSDATAGQDFFRSQRELLGERLDTAQADLRKFRETKGADLISEEPEAIRTQLATLEIARSGENTKLAELEARESFLVDDVLKNPTAISNDQRIASNTTILFLKARLLELELKRSETLSRYANGSKFLGDIDRQIGDTRALKNKEEQAIVQQMIAETRSELAVVRARIELLAGQIADNQDKLVRIENVSGEQHQLEQELSAARESYSTYLKKEEEARFSKALDESRIVNLSVAEPAVVPNEPEAAHQLEQILLGGLLSMLLGIAVAFLREQLDPTVKSSDQAERLTGLPVISEIPS